MQEVRQSAPFRPFPIPSVTPRQQEAPGGKKSETTGRIMQGYAWDTLPIMDEEPDEQFERSISGRDRYLTLSL